MDIVNLIIDGVSVEQGQVAPCWRLPDAGVSAFLIIVLRRG